MRKSIPSSEANADAFNPNQSNPQKTPVDRLFMACLLVDRQPFKPRPIGKVGLNGQTVATGLEDPGQGLVRAVSPERPN
ncbi:MAG: hypothetical protein AMS14_01445 [Planctomycetes bacterium DG_20]|nr:MAG: hypothetical protein AMS14_01445 [Planctomycetes bacterium DG_20]